MASQPYLALYTGDWKKDPELSMCFAATRGIWIDLLCSIHDGRIGQVTGTAEQLSRLGRCDAASMTAALHDLQANRAANISERDGVFTVICRRMKKASDISLKRQEAGSKGGAKAQAKGKQIPEDDIESEDEDEIARGDSKGRCTQAEAEEFCESIGLPRSDGQAMFLHWQEKGWSKIKDWKLTIRKWHSFGYLPSQKNGSHYARPKPKTQGGASLRQEQLDRIPVVTV